jgi:putative ABC transport system permease protein
MNQFFESVAIALQAIWSNKLRSFLTVLGNIVAVTSIIAVVSLVQGLNASVSSAITSRVGADAFNVVRAGPTFTDEEQQRVQSNPKVTLDDADAIRKFGPRIALVMAEADSSGQAKSKLDTLDSMSIRGVTKEYASLPTTNVVLGRPITASEFDSGRNVAILGWDAADRLFGPIDPIDKTFALVLRPVAGRIRGHSPRGVLPALRFAPVAAIDRPAVRSHPGPGDQGRRDGRAADRPTPAAGPAGQLRARHGEHVP